MSWAARIPTLSGGDLYPTAPFAVDFVRGFYKAPGFRGADFTRFPNLTVTRSSTGYDLGATTLFAANVARTMPGSGLLMEGSRVDLFLNTFAPATQTITLAATGSHTCTVYGSGSVAIAAGTATITGAGTASAGSPLTINCTATGTITATVTGSPTAVNVEAAAFGSSAMPSTGSTFTRSADSVIIAGLSIPAPMTFYVEATLPSDNASGNKSVGALSVGTDQNNRIFFVRTTAGLLQATVRSGGSTVYAQTAAASGALTVKAAISHDGTTVHAAINGAALTSSSAAYPVGTVSTFAPGMGTDGSAQTFGLTRKSIIYPTAYNDAQLVALTT